jgi:hypothetical protein
MGINNMFAYNTPTAEDKAFLTQANADTYLSQNPNLTDDQRNQIKGMLDEDAKNGQTIYHITVGEVKTDNDPMDLINKITNLQNNQK